MHRLPLVLLMIASSAEAGAQIIRPRFQVNEPKAHASLGAGLQQSWSVHDGATSSQWDFGSGIHYVAALEKVVTPGVSVGLRGTHGRMPLTYRGPNATADADANVSQVFGVVHVASGRGFHSVLELSAGATMYSNFRSRNDGVKIGPSKPDSDFSFAFGYGFGYNLSPRFSVDVVQDLTTTLHQKTGLSAGEDTSIRMNSTRLVGRFGLGG